MVMRLRNSMLKMARNALMQESNIEIALVSGGSPSAIIGQIS